MEFEKIFSLTAVQILSTFNTSCSVNNFMSRSHERTVYRSGVTGENPESFGGGPTAKTVTGKLGPF